MGPVPSPLWGPARSVDRPPSWIDPLLPRLGRFLKVLYGDELSKLAFSLGDLWFVFFSPFWLVSVPLFFFFYPEAQCCGGKMFTLFFKEGFCLFPPRLFDNGWFRLRFRVIGTFSFSYFM